MLSFDAHQQLVSIHPFNDGNGCTARLLMSFVQHYYDQTLTVVFREDKELTLRRWRRVVIATI
jgi:Fic family protein